MPPSSHERTPGEQETLVFSSPEEAQDFREVTQERMAQVREGDVQRPREVVAEVVTEQMAQYGEGAESLKTPWEHSAAEHAEAQQLADVAFAKDLSAALKQARQSSAYPRNIDLLHDALTNQLYDTLVEHRLNRQPVAGWLLAVAGIVIVLLLVILLSFA